MKWFRRLAVRFYHSSFGEAKGALLAIALIALVLVLLTTSFWIHVSDPSSLVVTTLVVWFLLVVILASLGAVWEKEFPKLKKGK